jgi:hypothetical protein
MPPFGSGGLADQQRLIEVRAHALRTRSSTNPPITTGRYTDATERGTLTDTGLGRITSRGYGNVSHARPTAFWCRLLQGFHRHTRQAAILRSRHDHIPAVGWDRVAVLPDLRGAVRRANVIRERADRRRRPQTNNACVIFHVGDYTQRIASGQYIPYGEGR